MKEKFITSALISMINQRHLRKILANRIDHYIYDGMVTNSSEDLLSVRLKRYQFLSAMLSCILRNFEKGYISRWVVKNIINILVGDCLARSEDEYAVSVGAFKAKYNQDPPTFIVLSPTQRCNLNCIGCYAGSTARTAATIPFPIVDRIITEAHDTLGNRFMTISGGEPFMYRDDGRTLLDVFKKYSDMFFLVYTNGTLVDDTLAGTLADLGNVTPAISVEGFQKETDQRRGEGVFAKILEAFECLRQRGVLFGISATATSCNADLLLTDEFYDFYFAKQGASYMWQFQFMPIGRGKDDLGLMVTPEKRFALYRKWEQLLAGKKYCIADFWNSGVLSRGCIAYGRSGGYFYIDWHGNITPCVFIPYYVDNIYNLYSSGKVLADALFSDFMKNGRRWQTEYGLGNWKKPDNWLMPCSIRDHYEIFRRLVMADGVQPEDSEAKEALESPEYFDVLKSYDDRLNSLTQRIWEAEYLSI